MTTRPPAACPPLPPPPLAQSTLSAIKSTVTTRSWWISGLEVLALGSMVALIAFGIGIFIDEVIFSTSSSQGGLH